jgi:beta-mannosidase
VTALDAGWALAACEPGACAEPSGIGSLDWLGAHVPGTVADALRDAGRATDAIDERDWWFRTRFEAAPVRDGEEIVLVLDGLATVAEVYLNGVLVLSSESMFARSQVDVSGQLAGENELVICCRALAPLLAESRRPRQRWRQRVVADATLRFYRTMLIGRAAGFAPGPPVIGPWRPVRLERRRRLAVDAVELRPRIEDGAGVLAAAIELRVLGGEALEAVELAISDSGGVQRAELQCRRSPDSVSASGEVRVPSVARWWPHTHGDPALYDVTITATVAGAAITIDAGRVGFRELGGGEDLEACGLQLVVNGTPVFARGAVWMALEAAGRGSAIRARAGPCRRDEHAAYPRHRRLRVADLPRPLRRARHSRLAGLHVRQPRLSRIRSAVHGGGRARSGRCAARSRRQGKPHRAVWLERGRPAGRDGRPRSGARERPAVWRATTAARRRR